MEPRPIPRRDVLRALGLGAAALPLAGCSALGLGSKKGPPAARAAPRIVVGPVPVEAVPVPVDTLPRASIAAEPPPEREVVRPRRLPMGGTIGLVAPAGVLHSVGQVQEAVRDLGALGFKTRVGRHVLARFGFLAGTDQQRADDLQEMVEDPDVDAILALRGGWGCARVLPLLDYDLFRAHPKPIVGYSDVTALLQALYVKAGLVSFHGPVGISTWSAQTAGSFLDTLVRAEPVRIEGLRHDPRPGRRDAETVRGGVAEGRLVGGNLSVLAGLAGTEYLRPYDGDVVFFEEVGEDSYRIDRLLTQLELAGLLDAPAAVLFGQCSRCSDGGSSWSADEVIRQHLAAYNCPAWTGAPIGHVAPVYTLPVGLPVRTDADAGTLESLGPAVV